MPETKDKNIEFENLLIRFWENNINEEELQQLQKILESSKMRLKEFQELQFMKSAIDQQIYTYRFDSHEALQAIKRRLRSRQIAMKRWIYAAGIILIIGCGILFRIWNNQREPIRLVQNIDTTSLQKSGKVFLKTTGNRTIELKPDTLKPIADLYQDTQFLEEKMHSEKEVNWNSLYTTAAAVYSVILADSTKVWLNANSELRYPDSFNESERKVYLKGEAYFDVAKDSVLTFKVCTDEITIEVLGTEFNVKNYNEDKHMHITLVNGSVKVGNKNQELAQLNPLEQIDINTETGNFHVHTSDLSKVLAWRQNMFVFKNELLISILEQLSHWYNVRFFLDEQLKNVLYSGNISRLEPLERVLEIMRATQEIEFIKMDENKIKVIPKE